MKNGFVFGFGGMGGSIDSVTIGTIGLPEETAILPAWEGRRIYGIIEKK